ncbi:MAG: ATP-binding protein [Myxococcales bacterium]|nr:MAG: ATP-binding protein [Myxococcales bacterium]
MYKRRQTLALSSKESCFLWGPRQTGKSTLLSSLFPQAIRYDLLLSRDYRRLLSDPGLLREDCEAKGLNGKNQHEPIIIDEVQKLPELLDEVHWLIENRGLRFVLCGSSARKLKSSHANLLGGRALRYELKPLVSTEIEDFSLSKALNRGLLPRHYDSKHYDALRDAYVGEYLKEEIQAEALVRRLDIFSRFLQVAALSNAEILSYTTVGRDCGVSPQTVKSYYQILADTLVGNFLPAFRKRVKRRTIETPKFYFFDLGVVAELTRRGKVEAGSELFGQAFEHFIYMELVARLAYGQQRYPLCYWRTASGFEVDFILGDADIAIEIKSTQHVNANHLKGLKAFAEEYPKARLMLVSLDTRPRKTSEGIEILPWRDFLTWLWQTNSLL